MARFDVHLAPPGDPGLLLDVQSRFLDHLHTRVAVPLWPPADLPARVQELNPVFTIEGEDYVMVTQFLGAIRTAALGRVVGNLSAERDAITRALDILLTGF